MDEPVLPGLARVLGALAESLHPDALADLIVEELRAPLGVQAAALLGAYDDRLLIVGMAGFGAAQLSGLTTLPLADDYPATRAFHTAEVLIEPSALLTERYPALRPPTERWQRTLEHAPEGCTVTVPILVSGISVGAFTLVTTRTEWHLSDYGVLRALAGGLGLWLTHPDSGLPTPQEPPPPALAERQRRILLLASTGLTNTEIGVAVGVSTSTIKQEIRRVMALLEVDGREAAVARAAQLGLLDGGLS